MALHNLGVRSNGESAIRALSNGCGHLSPRAGNPHANRTAGRLGRDPKQPRPRSADHRRTLGRGPPGLKALNEAVSAFRAALQVRTRTAGPVVWGEMQCDLARALRFLGERIEGSSGTRAPARRGRRRTRGAGSPYPRKRSRPSGRRPKRISPSACSSSPSGWAGAPRSRRWPRRSTSIAPHCLNSKPWMPSATPREAREGLDQTRTRLAAVCRGARGGAELTEVTASVGGHEAPIRPSECLLGGRRSGLVDLRTCPPAWLTGRLKPKRKTVPRAQ